VLERAGVEDGGQAVGHEAVEADHERHACQHPRGALHGYTTTRPLHLPARGNGFGWRSWRNVPSAPASDPTTHRVCRSGILRLELGDSVMYAHHASQSLLATSRPLLPADGPLSSLLEPVAGRALGFPLLSGTPGIRVPTPARVSTWTLWARPLDHGQRQRPAVAQNGPAAGPTSALKRLVKPDR
jgi:hypothetical protein